MKHDFTNFYYDETSPSYLRWAVDIYSGHNKSTLTIHKGSVAGWAAGGYWHVQVGRKHFLAHHVVWYKHTGGLPEHEIDHEDHDGYNNAFTNLREVTHAINCRNRGVSRANNTGVTGVCWIDKINAFGNKILTAVAQCNSLDGKIKGKHFSTRKHGLLPAFAKACAWREAFIAELNAQGAGYTDTHGK